jgi:hypothetical protein
MSRPEPLYKDDSASPVSPCSGPTERSADTLCRHAVQDGVGTGGDALKRSMSRLRADPTSLGFTGVRLYRHAGGC